MNIALIGYGKMGRTIEELAMSQGHHIVGHFSNHIGDIEALKLADVCIEFTQPDATIENIRKIAPFNKKIVIGTTGWTHQLDILKELVETHQLSVIYSPNFALGVNIFQEILKQASKLFNKFSEYDVAGIEYHHNQKKDSPSGLATHIRDTIESNMPRLTHLPFSSVRCGDIFGIHTLMFDSPFDTITLTHTAKNRLGFAAGALQAADWLQDKQGLFTFNDCIKDIFEKEQLCN